MASRSFFLVPLVALVACAPMLVASTQCTGTSWPCGACSTAFSADTLIGKCKTCVNDAGAGTWACVNDCAQTSVKKPSDCLDCVGATKQDAWKCSVCNSVSDASTRDACYACAKNSMLPGWYCQRLVYTQKCYSMSNTLSTGCLGCMKLAGDNNVDACLRCANLGSTNTNKQDCMDCVVARKDTGGSAYSC